MRPDEARALTNAVDRVRAQIAGFARSLAHATQRAADTIEVWAAPKPRTCRVYVHTTKNDHSIQLGSISAAIGWPEDARRGAMIVGTGIPTGTYIARWQSRTVASMTKPATHTGPNWVILAWQPPGNPVSLPALERWAKKQGAFHG